MADDKRFAQAFRNPKWGAAQKIGTGDRAVIKEILRITYGALGGKKLTASAALRVKMVKHPRWMGVKNGNAGT